MSVISHIYTDVHYRNQCDKIINNIKQGIFIFPKKSVLPDRTYFCIYTFFKKCIFFSVSGFVIYFNCFIFRAE